MLSADVPDQQNQHIQMKQPITDALLDKLLKNYSQTGDLLGAGQVPDRISWPPT